MDLFVYGTLLRGATQGAMLAHLPRVDARISGRMYRMPGGYPALALGAGGYVYGELVSDVDERLLGILDRYEGVHEGLYVRRPVEVLVGLLRRPAVAYVGVDPERTGKLVKSGRWRSVVRRGGR